jgi:hypothetical protein
MTDQPLPGQAAVSQEAAQPPIENAQVQSKQEVLLTAEEVAAIVARELDKNNRQQQSLRAKQNNRVKAEIDKLVSVMKDSKIDLPDEQINRMSQTIYERIMSEDVNQQAPQPQGFPSKLDPATDTKLNYYEEAVLRNIAKMQADARMRILPDDPEFNLLDDSTGERFQDTMEIALKAKKERTTSKPEGNPAALPGAMGRGSEPNDLKTSYDKELGELLKNPGPHNIDPLRILKNKYRERGLQIE